MSWRDEKIAMQTAVQETFQYPATLHHAAQGDLTPLNVKWHREGDTIGEQAQVVLEQHEFVFWLQELVDLGDGDIVLKPDMELTLTGEGRFRLLQEYPSTSIQQTWMVAPV